MSNDKCILAEQGLDYKYRKILGPSEAEYVPVSTYDLIVRLSRPLDADTDYYYHIRYLRWHGYLLTLPTYLVVVALCLIRGVTVVWSCHNVIGHNIPSKRYNQILRLLIGRAASDIIVFHESLRAHLEPYEDKVSVACFGSFRDFFQNHSSHNPKFQRRYRDWLRKRAITGPDVVFLGVYTRHKNIEWLVEHLHENASWNGLVIAPGFPDKEINTSIQQPENLCLESEQKVVAEVDQILQSGTPVGYVAHENLSVPTSIYVFASYGVPMVVYDVDPLASLVKEHKFGTVYSDPDEIGPALAEVHANYQSYRYCAKVFMEKHTWHRARDVHAPVFDLS